MGYEFGADEPVREAIARSAREQLDRAVSELSEGVSEDPTRAIHNARKAIKKERSLLRLVRGAMPAGDRRRANATLRAAARELSATRDADATICALAGLHERFVGQLPGTTFDAIRAHLEARRDTLGRSRLDGALSAGVVQELAAVRLRVGDWRLRRGGWKVLESGLLRAYKRGRRAFAAARAGGRADDIHAWRKRVKDLWYAERLLAPTCGRTVRGHADELHRLSGLLGDDHDLAVLRNELTRKAHPVPVDVDGVLTLIDHRRDELESEALCLGHRVYAESPRAFRRRMRRSWKAGRALARRPYEQQPAELAAATREPRGARG